MLIELTPVEVFQDSKEVGFYFFLIGKRTGFPLGGGNDRGGGFLFLVIPAEAGIQFLH
ncbi:hypothetical protein [Candidatus Magnetomonas plexicatena]|uniref:hypothetical protein n=1 Tax=Candidatus Magnetomonas plexicatena TaxID=2552947 RepID=UPI001C76FA04|nr:hypothetical protein E2O03_001595 [Nitrospirales bacterium LBB_01]